MVDAQDYKHDDEKPVRCIISKLRVSDRIQAAVRAVELGLYTERNG